MRFSMHKATAAVLRDQFRAMAHSGAEMKTIVGYSFEEEEDMDFGHISFGRLKWDVDLSLDGLSRWLRELQHYMELGTLKAEADWARGIRVSYDCPCGHRGVAENFKAALRFLRCPRCGGLPQIMMARSVVEGDERAENAQPGQSDPGEISDGYHTFNELYAHRSALFLALLKSHGGGWAAEKHNDGTMHEGYFIAGMEIGGQQISYHLPIALWAVVEAVSYTHLTLPTKA